MSFNISSQNLEVGNFDYCLFGVFVAVHSTNHTDLSSGFRSQTETDVLGAPISDSHTGPIV